MAIMDAKATFAYEKDVTTTANTVISGTTVGTDGVITSGGIQVVDLGAAGDAVGQELTFKAFVGKTAIAASSGATIQVSIQTSDAVDSNWHDLLIGPAITVGATKTIVKGEKLYDGRIPAGSERYLRANVKVGTSATTAGTVNMFLTKDL